MDNPYLKTVIQLACGQAGEVGHGIRGASHLALSTQHFIQVGCMRLEHGGAIGIGCGHAAHYTFSTTNRLYAVASISSSASAVLTSSSLKNQPASYGLSLTSSGRASSSSFTAAMRPATGA